MLNAIYSLVKSILFLKLHLVFISTTLKDKDKIHCIFYLGSFTENISHKLVSRSIFENKKYDKHKT